MLDNIKGHFQKNKIPYFVYCNRGQKCFSPKQDFCTIKVYAELFMLKDSLKATELERILFQLSIEELKYISIFKKESFTPKNLLAL